MCHTRSMTRSPAVPVTDRLTTTTSPPEPVVVSPSDNIWHPVAAAPAVHCGSVRSRRLTPVRYFSPRAALSCGLWSLPAASLGTELPRTGVGPEARHQAEARMALIQACEKLMY